MTRGDSASLLETLDKQKFVITSQSYPQVFRAYLFPSGSPFFITSDSVLNAYHVLFEETLTRMEGALAFELQGTLDETLRQLDAAAGEVGGESKLRVAALTRAKIVLGVARRSLNDSFRFGDEQLDGILARECALVRAAEARSLPEWMGAPEGTLLSFDYTRHKPRGLYTESEYLRRYFRAVSWLQAVPFRMENDTEFLAVLLLGEAMTRAGREKPESKSADFFASYRTFLGRPDDWSVVTTQTAFPGGMKPGLDTQKLGDLRRHFEAKAGLPSQRPRINDQIRLPPAGGMNQEINFRVLPAFHTPAAELFHLTTERGTSGSAHPSGLEIAAALGSPFARNRLASEGPAARLRIIDENRSLFSGDHLAGDYYNALSKLFEAPHPNAPGFMKSEAWQIKTCNTVGG